MVPAESLLANSYKMTNGHWYNKSSIARHEFHLEGMAPVYDTNLPVQSNALRVLAQLSAATERAYSPVDFNVG